MAASEAAMALASDAMTPFVYCYLASALFATAYVAAAGLSELTCTLGVPFCLSLVFVVFAEGEDIVTALHAVRQPVQRARAARLREKPAVFPFTVTAFCEKKKKKKNTSLDPGSSNYTDTVKLHPILSVRFNSNL